MEILKIALQKIFIDYKVIYKTGIFLSLKKLVCTSTGESSIHRWTNSGGIQDDGTFSKINGTVTLCVESFSQSDIESLMAVLNNKVFPNMRIIYSAF